PDVRGMPLRSTAVNDGTMAVTATAPAWPPSTCWRARFGPRRHAWLASCSSWSAAGTSSLCGTRARATTLPSSSAATAFTDVVPMSSPTARGECDAGVIVRPLWLPMTDRPKALVTAPFRGEGLDTLRELADVVLDPWIDHQPLRIYDGEKLAARIKEEGADVLIVETDFVHGPVFDLPLRAIGSCRG